MKKILSIVLALTMILSFAVVASADATYTADMVAQLNGDAPTKVGDIFKVDFIVKNISTKNIQATKIEFNYNDVIAPVDSVEMTDMDSTYLDGLYELPDMRNWSIVTSPFENYPAGTLGVTVFSTRYATTGKDVEDGTFHAVSMYYKVLKEGTATISFNVLSDEHTNGTTASTFVDGTLQTLVINPVSYSVTIGDAPEPPAEKTITAITAPVVPAEVTVGDTVTLAPTVKATVDDAEEELALTWDPAEVDTSKAGEVAVKATVTVPEGYKAAEGVVLEYNFTVTVKDKEPEPPAVKTITAITAPVVPAEVTVGDTVTLAPTVKATVDDAEEELALTWDPAEVDTSKAGEVAVKATVTIPEGYVAAEGVETEFSFTVTVKDKEPEPGDSKEIVEIKDDLSQFEGTLDKNQLPTQLEVTLADGTTTTVDVEWSYVGDSIVGTVTTPGYNTSIEIKVQRAPEAAAPAQITYDGVKFDEETGVITANIHVTLTEGESEITIDPDKPIYLVYNAYNVVDGKKVVVFNSITRGATNIPLASIADGEGNQPLEISMKADQVDISLVQDFDWNEVLSGTNLGSPIALGVTITK